MAVTRDPLRQLIRQADSVAESALTLTWRTLDTLRGRLVRMIGKKENLAGSAAARGVFYKAVQAECRILSERINTLQQKLIKSAGIGAAKAAAKTTGLKVEYSEKRAKAIAEIVTPAQGKNLAAVFTENMSERMIKSLREATVQSIREQGAAGGTLKDQSHDLAAKWQDILGKGKPVFVDSAGKMWDASRYLQMNTRTNAMRVYNDCLADDIARVSPSDHPLARISADGDPHCDCAAWEGIIISLDGKDSRFPSYDDARLGGCFHPNCVHTLEYVDEVADADEIKIQGKHPVGDVEDWDAMDERKYQIDQERYKERGLNADEARLAVDRDNLTDSIRNGLVTASARSLVDALTPEQVTKLCKDGNPPEFEPIKLTKRERARMSEEEIGKLEKWNHGTYGGVVHIDRETLTTEKLVKVCKLDEETKPEKVAEAGYTPNTQLEINTHQYAQGLGLTHSPDEPDLALVNPNFHQGREWQINCQMCVPTFEMNYRGYKCTVMPHYRNPSWSDYRRDQATGRYVYTFGAFKNAQAIGFSQPSDIEAQMKKWGDGARAQITVAWKGGRGAHTFFAIQENGITRFIDPQTNNSNYTTWKQRYSPTMGLRSRPPVQYASFARIDNLEFSDNIKDCCKRI